MIAAISTPGARRPRQFSAKRLFLAALLLVFGGSVPCLAQQSAELRNQHVVARFGSRGLESLENLDTHRHVDFKSDAFSLELDDVNFTSSAVSPTLGANSLEHSITYTYKNPRYEIQVRYELQPGWRFVSKQLAVARSPRPVIAIHRVEPLSIELSEAQQSTYIPGAFFPHFSETREQSRSRNRGTDYGAFVRLAQNTSAMFLVQNPFLEAQVAGNRVSLSYSPEMEWRAAWGLFTTDRACVGIAQLTGDRLPANMVREWQVAPAERKHDGADRAEIEAFTDCVRAFLVNPTPDPISVEVGWTLNDYQIDVAKPEGRAEYKRVMDTASELGIGNLLYAPTNTDLAEREDDSDDWNWEHVTWLGFGQKIRKNKWNPESGAIPASVAEMLDYAKSKNIGLLAYIYPSLAYAQNPDWLVTDPRKSTKNQYAMLASREFQDFLIRELLAFKRRLGLAGFSFDYTFLNVPGPSQYAQWLGWKRVMETLKREEPNIVIDGRQTYQTYGPWSWLASSYPHPTGTDEQPESFTPYPDLHFDRVSADRERYVDYWYRDFMFAPEELIPGYMTHQTERSRNVEATANGAAQTQEEFVNSTYRARDWDYLGFKYSVISSIASGGWNNVMDMIPGRDLAEFQNFSAADKKWIRDWIAWTRENKEFLRHTRTIIGQPAMGKADGTAAIVKDRGFIFLFNPNYQPMVAQFRLDPSIGLEKGSDFVLQEVYPRAGNLIGGPTRGLWKLDENAGIRLPGTAVMVVAVIPRDAQPANPLGSLQLFNAGPGAKAHLDGNNLVVEGVTGEVGAVSQIEIAVPAEANVATLTVNGAKQQFARSEGYVRAPVIFDGIGFAQAQQVDLQPGALGSLAGSFLLPKRIKDQLAVRAKAWPIPWTREDCDTTWLAPERLLLFVQIAEPKDSMQVTMTMDGHSIELKKAYSSVRASADSFVGFYADVSAIVPDVEHTITLNLPPLKPGQFQGVFFDNVEPEYTDKIWQHQSGD